MFICICQTLRTSLVVCTVLIVPSFPHEYNLCSILQNAEWFGIEDGKILSNKYGVMALDLR